MRVHHFCLIAFGLWAVASPVVADAPPVDIGGDRYASGSSITQTDDADRDLLAFGGSVTVTGNVAQDVHAMGFDVEIDGAIGGDVVAAGASVSVDGPVAGDLTLTAMTLRTGASAEIGGNARLAGGTVTINGPVLGALVVAAGEVTLNAPVSGDVALTAADITFGPEARIDGTLSYSRDAPIDVPDRVASADRVQFQPASQNRMWHDARSEWRDWDSPIEINRWAMVGGFLINLGLFIVIGAILLTLAPDTVSRLRHRAEARPGMVILSGVIGLSILFGMVPVSALTIVGLPLVPILVLLIVLAWVLGYILGAYVLAMRVMHSMGGDAEPTLPMRLVALAIGVTLVALLNFIPFIGWFVNFILVLLGIGAIAAPLTDGFLSRRAHQPDTPETSRT